jgi:hypothetical protein
MKKYAVICVETDIADNTMIARKLGLIKGLPTELDICGAFVGNEDDIALWLEMNK